MDTCPATKTGKPLTGMAGFDCQFDLDVNNQTPINLPAIAAAVAEISQGTVSHIDPKDPVLFYFLSAKDEARLWYFEDVWVRTAWLNALRPEWAVSISGDGGVAYCQVTNGTVTVTSESCQKDQNKAESIALFKCLLSLRRSGELLFKEEQCQISEPA